MTERGGERDWQRVCHGREELNPVSPFPSDHPAGRSAGKKGGEGRGREVTE